MKVGIAGFGFMGRTHFRCWKRLKDVEITAICDANPAVVEEIENPLGNIQTSAESIDLRDIRIYSDFDKMLDREQLDAVSVTVPSFLHAELSIKALQAGVHVLCEKPMALCVADCDRMIESTRSTGKVLMIAHCIRFWPEYTTAREIVRSGRYGRVVAAAFRRLGAKPGWTSNNWVLDEKRSGGIVTDLQIHDTDFVQYLFGMPAAVQSFAAADAQGRLIHILTSYLFNDRKLVTAEASWAMAESFGFEMSFHIVLESATIVYNSGREPTLKLYPADEPPFCPQVPGINGYSNEIKHFFKKIKGEPTEQIITLEQSRNTIRIVEAQRHSLDTAGPVSLEQGDGDG